MMIRTLVLMGFVTFLSASVASAQTQMPEQVRISPDNAMACGEGLVSNDATDGHCCWPGQMWSDERERCIGTPRCPAGWKVQGSLCIRGEVMKELVTPTAKPAPVVVTPPPPAKVAELAAPKTEAAPERPPARTMPEVSDESKLRAVDTVRAVTDLNPPPNLPDLADDEGRIPYDDGPIPNGYHLTTRVRRGLIIPGSIMFGVSYGMTALLALSSISSTSPGSESVACANTDYLGLIPLAGGYAWGNQADRKCSSSFGFRTFFGAIDSAVQIAGGTMMVIAFLAPEKYLVRDVAGLPTVSVRIVPGTQLTSSGLSLAGKF